MCVEIHNKHELLRSILMEWQFCWKYAQNPKRSECQGIIPTVCCSLFSGFSVHLLDLCKFKKVIYLLACSSSLFADLCLLKYYLYELEFVWTELKYCLCGSDARTWVTTQHTTSLSVEELYDSIKDTLNENEVTISRWSDPCSLSLESVRFLWSQFYVQWLDFMTNLCTILFDTAPIIIIYEQNQYNSEEVIHSFRVSCCIVVT